MYKLSKEQIKEMLINILSNVKEEGEEQLTREEILHSNYSEDNIFDSITFVLLIVRLEEEFKVSIDEDNLLIENLSSFDVILDMLGKLGVF